MRVRCIEGFYDLELKVDREVGDEWDVTKERYESILSVAPYVEAVEAPKKTRSTKAKAAKPEPNED